MVSANGRLWRARAAISDDRSMPKRRTGLAGGRVQSLQDPSEFAARCHSPVAGYTDLEIGGFAQMPILPERSYSAAGANDQADRGAGDHALQVGASGRGEVRRIRGLTNE